MFKKTITRHLPEGARILPGAKQARLPDGTTVDLNANGMMVTQSTNFYTRINGVVTPLTPKKKESEAMEADLKAKARRKELGIEDVQAPANEALEPLITTWLGELVSAGRNSGHIAKLRGRIKKILGMAGISDLASLGAQGASAVLTKALGKIGTVPNQIKLPDGAEFSQAQIRVLLRISPSAMTKLVKSRNIIGNGKTGPHKRISRAEALALVAHRNVPKSPATLNGHRIAVLSFANWLRKQGKLTRVPYLGMPKDESKNRRRVRRILSWEQCVALSRAAADDKPHRGMTGPERATLYTLCFVTMLRRRALMELVVEDCNLSGEHPFLSIRSETDKNKIGRAVPIPPPVAKELAKLIKGRSKAARVFNIPLESGALVRHDLKLAGIPFKTVDGIIDLHSFRGSGASFMAQRGVPLDLIARVGGWKDISTIFKRYRRFSVDSMGQALKGMWPQ